MSKSELEKLFNDELLVKKKKARTYYLVSAGLICAFIGVAMYSAIKNGGGVFTFFPLAFVFLLLKSGQNYKGVEREVKQCSLK